VHLPSVRAVRTTVTFLRVQSDAIDVDLSIARYPIIEEAKKAASGSMGLQDRSSSHLPRMG
jgi:hypothetical protein